MVLNSFFYVIWSPKYVVTPWGHLTLKSAVNPYGSDFLSYRILLNFPLFLTFLTSLKFESSGEPIILCLVSNNFILLVQILWKSDWKIKKCRKWSINFSYNFLSWESSIFNCRCRSRWNLHELNIFQVWLHDILSMYNKWKCRCRSRWNLHELNVETCMNFKESLSQTVFCINYMLWIIV